MKPLPSIRSFRRTARNEAKSLSWKLSRDIPVRGVPLAMKASAVEEISSISAGEKTCVHCSGLSVIDALV